MSRKSTVGAGFIVTVIVIAVLAGLASIGLLMLVLGNVAAAVPQLSWVALSFKATFWVVLAVRLLGMEFNSTTTSSFRKRGQVN